MLFATRIPILSLYIFVVYLVFILLYVLHHVNLFYIDRFLEFDTSNTIFDYIVVGCGSAGAVVAKRLAENKNITVLVLEAGQHGYSFLDIPLLGLLLQNTPFDWHYTTVPQSQSCLALNDNKSIWPMGKIVGGTGMLNNMVYVRGHEQDFHEWYKDKEGYSFKEDVLPYFKKFEQSELTDRSQSSPVNNIQFTSILPKFILNGAEQLGFKVNEDTENCAEGFGLPKTMNHNGARWTPSHYLAKLNKRNVIIKTNSLVDQILFRRNYEAYGVRYSFLDRSRRAFASKGIILSAGVIGSPKILMHSGIGPKSHLDDVNITAKLDLPVGENLQDHVTTGLDLILVNRTLGAGIRQMVSPVSAFDYFWSGTGPWTTGGCEIVAFFDTRNDTTAGRPDLQFMVMPLGINEDGGLYLRHLTGIKDGAWNDYFALAKAAATVTVLPVLLHPNSRGTVRLRDAHFGSEPLIDPAYLARPEDIAVLLRGIGLIKDIVNTVGMRALGARLNENAFPGCDIHLFDSKEYWECYVRHLTLTAYHPVGTCKMAGDRDSSGVVNYDFEVKGANNLFVVDGSVMPSLTSGNVNGAILMLAEMASDRLKFRDNLNTGHCRFSEIFIKKHQCTIF